MDMQNVSNLVIPEGNVRTIHDKNNRIIWGMLAYDTKYAGNTLQNGTPTPTTPQPINVVTGEQNVVITGKNILPVKNIARTINNVTFTPQADGSIKLSGTASAQINYPINNNSVSVYRNVVLNAGSYTVYQNTNPQTGVFVQVFYVDGGASKYSTGSFTVNDYEVSLGAYIRVNNGINTDGVVVKPMLVSGSVVGGYEPYQGSTYTVSLGTTELCKIGDYQDYIYKSGDDWYVHKAIERVILNGSETWNKANVSFQTVAATTQGVVLAANMSGYSNYFVHHYYPSGISSNIQNGEFGWSSSRILTMRNDDCADANAFKIWLAEHNTSVYYQLATPTDTQITDADLITQLNNIHQFLTRYGYNFNVSGNLPIIIDKTDLS